jgi:hypothetical protein
VSLDVLDFSLLIIDQYPNNNKHIYRWIGTVETLRKWGQTDVSLPRFLSKLAG